MAVPRHRDFNLRHPILHVEGRHEFTHRYQHVGNLFGKNPAFLHVGHIARALFMEPHENAALLFDVAHREARTMTIVPEGPVDRSQQAFGIDADKLCMNYKELNEAALANGIKSSSVNVA